ncbi:MAG: PepSY-like domain-containing protein [Tannerellaceae bacterium]
MANILMLLFLTLFPSCQKDIDTQPYDTLPIEVQSFVGKYYPAPVVKYVHVTHDTYKIYLNDGILIKFDRQVLKWTQIDDPAGISSALQADELPSILNLYLTNNYPEYYIVSMTHRNDGYSITLYNGTKLKFSADGSFIKRE